MRPEEIPEGNKLIAEFMCYTYIPWNNTDKFRAGYWHKNAPKALRLHAKTTKIDKMFYLGRTTKELKYRSSWDWLMPVVEKIESLECISFFGIQKKLAYIAISESPKKITHKIESSKLVDEIIKGVPTRHSITKDSKLESVYYVVVEFIKWYNNQKK